MGFERERNKKKEKEAKQSNRVTTGVTGRKLVR